MILLTQVIPPKLTETPMMNPMTVPMMTDPMTNPTTIPMMTDPIDSSYHNGFYDEFY